MRDLIAGFIQAVELILAGDPALFEVIALSLWVTGIALFFSTLVGIPVGAWLGLKRFTGRRLVMALLYTGMGFPPVVVGLFVYLMLSRSGPAGSLGWLFTPKAMVTAQTIISFPLVAGFTMAAVMGVDPNLRQQVQSLGATEWQTTLVGGNIENKTRVLTTAIVLETRKGNFDLAMALGMVLLSLSFMANLAMLRLQGQDLLRR
jgi:tungstate transport system permease protein